LISFIEKKYKNKFNIKWIKHVTKFGREIISTNDNEKLIRIYKKLLNEIYGKNWKFFNFEIQKNINDLKKKNNNIKN
jgi:hypothetical protein